MGRDLWPRVQREKSSRGVPPFPARRAAPSQFDVDAIHCPRWGGRVEVLRQGRTVGRKVRDRPAIDAHQMAVLLHVSVEAADAAEHPLAQLSIGDEAAQVAIHGGQADGGNAAAGAHEDGVGRRVFSGPPDDVENQLAVGRCGPPFHTCVPRQHIAHPRAARNVPED